MRPRTLRRIESEDGSVVEEQERFAELVSSEYLLQNLKGLRVSIAKPPMTRNQLKREDLKLICFDYVWE